MSGDIQGTRIRIVALQFLNFAAMGAGGAFLSLYLQQIFRGGDGTSSLSFIGLLFFGQNIVALVSSPVAGYVADRFRIENLILTTCSVMVTASAAALFFLGTQAGMALPTAQRVLLGLGAMIVNGLFFRPLIPLIDTETLEFLHETEGRGTNYGRYRLFGSTGWFVGSAATGLAVSLSGRLQFAILAYAIGFVLLGLTAATGFRAKMKAVEIPWEHLRGDRMFKLFLVVVFFVVYAISGSFVFTSYMMAGIHSPDWMIGLAFGASALPELPIMYASPWLLRRVGNRAFIVIGGSLLAAKLAWYVFLPRLNEPLLFVAGQLFHGVGYGFLLTGFMNLLDRQTREHLRATYQALFNLVQAVAMAVSTVTAGLIYDRWGYGWLMGTAAVILIAALAFFLVGVRGHGPEKAASPA